MEILKGKAIRIEREHSPVGETPVVRETIGYIPAVSGVFEVEGKSLVVTICPTDTGKTQKVIFEGEAFPTVNVRGGRQRQQAKLPSRRRVLNFSSEPTRKVRQEAGRGESLLFSYVPIGVGRGD